MLKNKYLINGDVVTEDVFMLTAEEALEYAVQSAIADNIPFTLDNHEFEIQSYKLSDEEQGFMLSMVKMISDQNTYVGRDMDSNLVLQFDLDDNIVNIPMNPEFFSFIKEGDVLSIKELHDILEENEDEE